MLTAVTPVPEDAPDPLECHPHLGYPGKVWTYKSSSGLLGYVYRFETDKGKELRPLTYCANDNGPDQWAFRSWTIPRPLYNLDKIQKQDDAQIIMTEGEKACDAVETMVPNYIVSTAWHGGTNALKSVDFSPLFGKRIVFWPDLDDPGFKVATDLFEKLAGRCEIRIFSAAQRKTKRLGRTRRNGRGLGLGSV